MDPAVHTKEQLMGSLPKPRPDQDPRMREYERGNAVVFLKTNEPFGGLSNMAPGFPLRVNSAAIRTSEALYQACRFPHIPELQRRIIDQPSPMTAKMVGKPFRDNSRPDWERVRTKIMRWCLRVKLAQNFERFSSLLLATGDRPIVEQSRKDDFWGAKPESPSRLVGANILGRLLMELREIVRENGEALCDVAPLELPDFMLFGRPIEAIGAPSKAAPGPNQVPDVPQLPSPIHRESMTATIRKKLIEVSIPLEAINAASKKQKAPKGYPTAIHKYWAQRPIAACRAVLFAQLVDDPSAWPDRFPTEEAQDAERRRLHKVIERMVPWEASNDQAILNEARWEIARSVAWGLGEEPPAKGDGKAILDYLQAKAPPVYDPFSGAGSIPLEAQRLGLRAYGSDLNPVAVLIGKGLVEIPPKFAGLPPVNPKAQAELKSGAKWNGKGAQGLAEDVRFYGQWMRDEAEKRIGHLYPKAKLPDGSEATIIAWLWARTVRSPDPAAKGAMVPLVSTFMLSTKEGTKSWVAPVIEASAHDGWRFEVKTGLLAKGDEERLKKGTKAARGNFSCLLTGAPITEEWTRSEGRAHRLGVRLMAIVADRKNRRSYFSPDEAQESAATQACAAWLPDGELFSKALGFRVPAYGLTKWADLFTSRQLKTLTTLSELVCEARENVFIDACAAARSNNNPKAKAAAFDSSAYADAIATYLAFIVDRAAEYSSVLTTWLTDDNAIRGTFGRQALPMVWDFCEGNFLGKSSAGIRTIIDTISAVLDHQNASTSAFIVQTDAARNGYHVRPCIINTDPPYYDNIGYADLSDYFYVWMRKSLAKVWPDLFRRLSTPKEEELVATPYRHGGKADAEAFFMRGMSDALKAMFGAAASDQPMAIYYAFKQSETNKEGLTSAGWAAFLQSVVEAGFSIDGTWPVRTESAGRLRSNNANALASSVVLVCRKRAADASTVTRAEFIRALKREMPDAIDNIRKAGVGPVDMQQSVIGPGMGVFTRYSRVLESDDSPMSVKTALTLINRVWEEIENELDANFDPETQVALAWYGSYGYEVQEIGRTERRRQRQERAGEGAVQLPRLQQPARQRSADAARRASACLVARDRQAPDRLALRAASRAGAEGRGWRRRRGGEARRADGAARGGRAEARLPPVRDRDPQGPQRRGARIQRTCAGMGEARRPCRFGGLGGACDRGAGVVPVLRGRSCPGTSRAPSGFATRSTSP